MKNFRGRVEILLLMALFEMSWLWIISYEQLQHKKPLKRKLKLNQKYSKAFYCSSPITSLQVVTATFSSPSRSHFRDKSKMSLWWWAIYLNYFLSQLPKRKSYILPLLLSELPSKTQLQDLKARARGTKWGTKSIADQERDEKTASILKTRLWYDKNDNLCILISAPVPFNYVSWWPGIKVPGPNQHPQLTDCQVQLWKCL